MHLGRSNVTIIHPSLPPSHRVYSDRGIPTGGILTRYSDKGIATGDILTGGIPTRGIPTGSISCRYSHRWYPLPTRHPYSSKGVLTSDCQKLLECAQMHLGLGNATINVRPFVAFKHYYNNRKFTSVA